MTTVSGHACTETFAPLVYRTIDDFLVKLSPLFNEALFQVIHITNSCPVDSILKYAPYLVVHWVEVWTIRRPQRRRDERRCIESQHLNCVICAMGRSAVLLKDKEFTAESMTSQPSRWRHRPYPGFSPSAPSIHSSQKYTHRRVFYSLATCALTPQGFK